MINTKKIVTGLSMLAFATALSLPAATSAEPNPAGAKSAAKSPASPQHRERHPEIRDAIQLLNQAQDHLNHAAHDFGGHRVKAMKHISEALEELHAAEQFDKH